MSINKMSSNIFPSYDAWVTPRAEGVEINSNNCMIMLPQKIDKIDKVLVKASTINVMAQREYTGGRPWPLSDFYLQKADGYKVEYLDITKYIVEEAKYQALPYYNIDGKSVITKLAKNNVHYYKHNGANIRIVNVPTEGVSNKTTTWDMAIQASFVEFATKTQLYLYDGSSYREAYPIESNVSELKNNLMSAQFRVYYTPLGESVKLQVPKTNPQINQFCIPYSQQQPIVDNVALGREMQSVANRAGCETREVVRTLNNISEKRKLGTTYRERSAR